MTSAVHGRTRRTAAIAVALAAGSTLALAGPASAHSGHPGHHGNPGHHGHHGHGPAATSAPLVAGLYQSGYSERNHVLWATASAGRAPAATSSLLKVDPRTLKVEAAYTPPVTDPATGDIQSVYGIAVDDEHNTVWTTNTRADSVSVYSQRTGKVLATVPNVSHAREIVVDQRHNTVWATGLGDGTVVAIDSRTYKEKKRVTVEGSTPAGIAVNTVTGTAYATDLGNDRIIELNLKSSHPRFIPTGDGPISIALSRDGRTAYTADQAGGDVSVVDLRKGKVTTSVPTGAGALSVAADHRTGRVVVANRTAGTVSIVDPRKGVAVTTVPVGANPNHVEVAGGVAYVLDKSGSGPAGEDQVHRIRLTR